MATWVDGVIVSLIAIGATVLIGVLGYFADKGAGDNSGEPASHKPEGKKA